MTCAQFAQARFDLADSELGGVYLGTDLEPTTRFQGFRLQHRLALRHWPCHPRRFGVRKERLSSPRVYISAPRSPSSNHASLHASQPWHLPSRLLKTPALSFVSPDSIAAPPRVLLLFFVSLLLSTLPRLPSALNLQARCNNPYALLCHLCLLIRPTNQHRMPFSFHANRLYHPIT